MKIAIDFLKRNWQALLAISLAIFIVFSIKSCNDKNQLIHDLKGVKGDTIPNGKIKEWEDRYGKEHETVTNLQADRDALKSQLDSVSSLLKIKPKSITSISYQGSILALDKQLKVDTFYREIPARDSGDSIKVASQYDFIYNDAWMHISGSLGAQGDSVHIIGTDTLTRVDYTRRKWLLAPLQHYSDFSNSNPHIKTVGYKGVQFRENKTNWSVGISIQGGYQFNQFSLLKPTFSAGISLQYSIFKF